MNQLIRQRSELEQGFTAAKDEMASIEQQLQQLNDQRSTAQQQVEDSRAALESHKLGKQEVVVRKKTQEEHLANMELDQDAVMADLPEKCNVRIHRGSWPVQPIFEILQKQGKISEHEMMHVFNMMSEVH